MNPGSPARAPAVRRYGRGLLSALGLVLAGCAGLLVPRHDLAPRLAAENGWEAHALPAGRFTLAAYSKGLSAGAKELVVYLESDGYAWRSKFRASPDPTPVDPIAFRLALRDPAPVVLYLARPCQYTTPETGKGCDPIYWTTHRFAPAVVEGTSRAIDAAKGMAGASRVALVGYSGGGGLATLVAAHRDDVSRLVTVAGVLDHPTWTRLHGVTPMTGSLNPADFAAALRGIPQVHFVGADDERVPPAVAAAFRERLPGDSRVRVVVVPGFDHECCWVAQWRELREQHLPPEWFVR